MKPVPIVVVGAGPAGTAAACHLAKAGLEVVLLEREAGPHHKVCGECLRPEAIRELKALGMHPASAGAESYEHLLLHGRGRTVTVGLEGDFFGFSRYALDQLLIHQAQSLGVDFRPGSVVQDFTPFPDQRGFRLLTNSGTLECRTLIWATGKKDLPRYRPRRGKDTPNAGFKMHYRPTPAIRDALRHQTHLYYFEGGYCGLGLVEDNRLNCCLVIAKKHLARAGGNFSNILRWIGRDHPGLEQLSAACQPLFPKPLAMALIPYGHLESGRPLEGQPPQDGLFYVGDQLAVPPSLTGNGMAMALASGRWVAEYFLENPEGESRRFHQKASRNLRSRVAGDFMLHRLARNPLLVRLLLNFFRLVPAALRALVRGTRVPGTL